jgi:hypothetical protein
MKKIAVCVLLIVFLPMLAVAAQVFGSLKYEDRSVGQGVDLKIQCVGEKEVWAKTDAYGSYSAYLPRPKKCGLQVSFGKQWTDVYDIYPDETDPVRYDFELVKRDNGTLFLRRK